MKFILMWYESFCKAVLDDDDEPKEMSFGKDSLKIDNDDDDDDDDIDFFSSQLSSQHPIFTHLITK